MSKSIFIFFMHNTSSNIHIALYFIDIWDDSDNIPVYPDTFSDPPELQPAESPDDH